MLNRRILSESAWRAGLTIFAAMLLMSPLDAWANAEPACSSAPAQAAFPISLESVKLGDWTLKIDAKLRGAWSNRAATSAAPAESQGDVLFAGFVNVQKHLLDAASSPSCPTQDPALYQFCQGIRQRQDAKTLHQGWFGGKSDQDLSVLSWSVLAPVSVATADVPILRTFERFMEAKDFDEMKRIAADNPDHLSNEQFLGLVSMWGSAMNEQYDKKRSERIDGHEKGNVTPDQILSAAQGNLANHAYWGEAGPVGVQTAGVCRDIAVAQAALFDARFGKGSALVISMSTVRGGHSLVVARNPDQHGQTLHFNYGRILRTENADGSRALHVAQNDFGDVTPAAYGVYDSNGAPVARVPSELGKLMQEAMELPADWIDPLARKSSSLVRVGIEGRSKSFVPELGVGVNAVTGQTAVGHTVAGGGVSARVQSRRGATTSVTAELLGVARTPEGGESDQSSYLSGTLAAAGIVHRHPIVSRDLPKKNLKLQVFGEASLQASAYHYGNEGAWSQDVTMGGKIEATLEKDARKAGLDEVLWKTRLGVIVLPMNADSRSLNGSFDPLNLRPIPNAIYAEAGLKKPLSLLSAAELQALLSVDGIGARGRVRVGYRGPKCQAGLSWSGRVWTNEDARGASLLQESSLQRLGLDGGCELAPGIQWDATLDTALDASDSTQLMTGVGGSF